VIVTTSLALVVFSTVVFGSTVGVLQKCLFGSGDTPKVENAVENPMEEMKAMEAPLLQDDD